MIYNFENLNFQIITIGKFKNNPGIFQVKKRPFASLSIRLSGNGKFKTAETEFVSNPGDITFMPANTNYCVEYTGGECIAVHLANCNYQICENIKSRQDFLIYSAFEELLKIKDDIEKTNKKKSVVYNILQMLCDNANKYFGADEAQICINFIEKHFSNPRIGVKDICRAGNVSESTLRRKFNACFGISPKQYLINIRINTAVHMLTETKKTVKEISFDCGFEDEKYFSRCIKKYFGVSPKDLKKNL